MDKLDPKRLPRIRRSEAAARERCPRCGGHLRRLGDPDPTTREIAEKGLACTNPKCGAKVLERYQRLGITEVREVAEPDAKALARVENLMRAREEREALKPVKPAKDSPRKLEER